MNRLEPSKSKIESRECPNATDPFLSSSSKPPLPSGPLWARHSAIDVAMVASALPRIPVMPHTADMDLGKVHHFGVQK